MLRCVHEDHQDAMRPSFMTAQKLFSQVPNLNFPQPRFLFVVPLPITYQQNQPQGLITIGNSQDSIDNGVSDGLWQGVAVS